MMLLLSNDAANSGVVTEKLDNRWQAAQFDNCQKALQSQLARAGSRHRRAFQDDVRHHVRLRGNLGSTSSPVESIGLDVIQASKPESRIMRYQLTDFEWAAIRSFLPNKPRGIPRVDDRRVLNGVLWVLRSGAPWRDLPVRYGPRTTCAADRRNDCNGHAAHGLSHQLLH
jgi:hypothetical protein